MKVISFFSVFLLCAAVCLFPQEKVNSVTGVAPMPGFYADVNNFATADTSMTRCDVFVQVPFNKIQFVKKDKLFSAEYLVTVSVYDEKKVRLLVEKMWSEKVETADFNQTLSKSNYNLSLKSINLKPALYFIKIVVEDKDSRKTTQVESPFQVRSFGKLPAISDCVILNSPASQEAPGKLTANVARVVTSPRATIPLYFELYADSSSKLSVTFSLVNVVSGKTVYTALRDYPVKPGKNQMFYSFDSVEVPVGDYKLYATLQDVNFNTIQAVNKTVASRLPGVPFFIRDLDKAIDQMVYIASAGELDKIKKGRGYEERLALFREFWIGKDPNKTTEENEIFTEYYRRIDYANRNFTHYVEGWRTDMGMVFVILGAPNNIDRHPFDYNSKPYEVWEYYDLNKQFVFMDATGFGDYRLLTPLTGDNYRYRQ